MVASNVTQDVIEAGMFNSAANDIDVTYIVANPASHSPVAGIGIRLNKWYNELEIEGRADVEVFIMKREAPDANTRDWDIAHLQIEPERQGTTWVFGTGMDQKRYHFMDGAMQPTDGLNTLVRKSVASRRFTDVQYTEREMVQKAIEWAKQKVGKVIDQQVECQDTEARELMRSTADALLSGNRVVLAENDRRLANKARTMSLKGTVQPTWQKD